MNAPGKITMTENQLQCSAVDYLRSCALPGVIYFHVPNEGDRTKGQKIHMYRMGLLAGMTDFVLFKEAKPYAIEFKVDHNTLSDDQWKVRKRCEDQGIPYAVVRTPERFVELMKEWEMVR